jgi:peptidyl-prolyl cis-trans isomerase B (cyclophilin B)
MITLHTNKGDIKISLFNDKAPKTCKNFQDYVDAGHYNGTIFHRVIKKFMIQGGGFTEDMVQKKTRDPIENEADNGLSNKKYTIAMARTSDPHSATCQFFINTVDNNYLDFRAKNDQGWGYCVFGEVVEGKDVVDAIEKVETGFAGFMRDVPKESIVIISAKSE